MFEKTLGYQLEKRLGYRQVTGADRLEHSITDEGRMFEKTLDSNQ